MNENVDCRVCESYERVYEEFPSANEPIIVYSYHRCSAFDKIFFSTPELRDAFRNCPKKSLKIGYGTPMEIVEEIKSINLAFRQITGKKENLIEIKSEQATLMSSPCFSIVDFTTKVGVLASILEMNVGALREVVSKYNNDWGSLKLLETLFIEKEIYNDDLKSALNLLKDIVALRNRLAPFHSPSMEAREIAKRLGISLTVSQQDEWQRSAEILLNKFLSSLRRIRVALSTLALEA